ncbi:MAG: putative tyrosine-protein kinase YveL [Syntrophomonadaceae bacterium]|nr:putative tyrosine-protein kinase YveL [Bacillota bacterium]
MIKSTKLVTNENIKSPIAEAYKTLRTNIQFSLTDANGGLKVLLITSSGPAEGKSITAANLAITMAQSSQKVLLVDCDLRKPVVHRAFSLMNSKGLTNILVEGVACESLVNMTFVDNLEVITSGPKPPNPSELLGSIRMRTLVDKFKESYDTVIIDSPPALPVTDAAVLSKLVDGVIIVAEYGQTTFESITQTKSMFDKVNARLLGVVLNRVPANHREYYYYYYQEDKAGSAKNGRRSASVKA